jgi:hypothetical protein
VKYQIGELVEFKEYIPRRSPPSPRRQPLCPRLHLHQRRPNGRPRLNSLGIILSCEDHKIIFESGSIEDDNGYVWFSQEESEEFFVYENELVKE